MPNAGRHEAVPSSIDDGGLLKEQKAKLVQREAASQTKQKNKKSKLIFFKVSTFSFGIGANLAHPFPQFLRHGIGSAAFFAAFFAACDGKT